MHRNQIEKEREEERKEDLIEVLKKPNTKVAYKTQKVTIITFFSN